MGNIRKVLPPVPGLLKKPLVDVSKLDPKEVGQAYDRMEAEATLSRELEGLVFATTRKFLEYIDTFPDNAPPEMMRRLLHMTAERLRRARTEEPLQRIVSMRQISIKNPTQYDGITETEDAFFIRYQNHKLTVHVDDALVEYQELPGSLPPNQLEFGQMRMLLRELFEFPEEDTVILKRL